MVRDGDSEYDKSWKVRIWQELQSGHKASVGDMEYGKSWRLGIWEEFENGRLARVRVGVFKELETGIMARVGGRKVGLNDEY